MLIINSFNQMGTVATSQQPHDPHPLTLRRDIISPCHSSSTLDTEEHLITLDPSQSLSGELQIYQLRQAYPSHIVSVSHVEVLSSSTEDGRSCVIRVLTERMFSTLRGSPKQGIDAGLSIMREAAIGFEKIFSQIGYFHISEDMIGFNANRQIRVWINGHWTKNATLKEQLASEDLSEHQLVLRLAEMVEAHIEVTVLLKNFVEKRMQVSELSFKKLKELISRFSFQHNLKLIKSIEVGNSSEGQKARKMLSFRMKSSSPQYVRLNSSLGSNREYLRNILNSRQTINHSKDSKHSLFDPNLYKEKAPHILEFKPKTVKPSDKLNHCNRRDGRHTKYLSYDPKSKKTSILKRLSQHQAGIFTDSENASEMPDKNYRVTLSGTSSLDFKSYKFPQNPSISLESVRNKLKNYLSHLSEGESLRSSCPAIQFQQEKRTSPYNKVNESQQLQFKTANMKKKKRPSMHIQDGVQRAPQPKPIQMSKFLPNKQHHKLKQQSQCPDVQDNSVESGKLINSTMQSTYQCMVSSCSDAGTLFSPNERKKFSIFDPTVRLEGLRSTLPNFKISDSGMIINKTPRSPANTTATLLSKTNEIKQSEVIPERSEEMVMNPLADEYKLFGLSSFTKNTLTRSINLPASKEKRAERAVNDKPLKMLDMLVVKRNVEKYKDEGELDISMEFSDSSEILRKSIEEIEEECD